MFELQIYKIPTGFRWRLVDTSLKGTAAFIGSGNQRFKTRAAAKENAMAVSAGLRVALKAPAKKAPAKKKAAAPKKAPAKKKAAAKRPPKKRGKK